MGFFGFYKYGIVFQIIALVHFVRRRPDNYWLWIILMGGGVGALAYIVVEVLPDMGMLRQSYKIFSHRKRIQQLFARDLKEVKFSKDFASLNALTKSPAGQGGAPPAPSQPPAAPSGTAAGAEASSGGI